MEQNKIAQQLDQLILAVSKLEQENKQLRADLQKGQAELRSRLDELQPSEEWQWLDDCYGRFHATQEAARQALRAGRYKSGTEYVKVSRRYKLNVAAIEKRLAKKQSRRAAV